MRRWSAEREAGNEPSEAYCGAEVLGWLSTADRAPAAAAGRAMHAAALGAALRTVRLDPMMHHDS